MLILFASLLGACAGSQLAISKSSTAIAPTELATPAPEAEDTQFIFEEISSVDSIDATFLESSPLQVHVVVKGNLPDGCTTIQRHEVSSKGNTFYIRIFTQRSKDAVCTQALVPFEYIVPLNVYGLPAGTYQVSVYNTMAEFTFSRDNVQQSTGGG